MRHSLISSFTFITSVLAGGYAGALERVWLYQALVLDHELNGEAGRTIGVQCLGAKWDHVAHTCAEWTTLKGRNGDPPKYEDFLVSLKYFPGGPRSGWAVYQAGNAGELDIEETAKNTFTKYTTARPGQNPSAAYVRNYGGHLVIKDTNGEYNDMISRVGQRMNQNYQTHAATMTNEQKAKYKAYDEALEKIKQARIGDHGEFVLSAARGATSLNGIDIKTMNVGTNPFPRHNRAPTDPDKVWDTVDWAETEKVAIANNIQDATTEINNWKTNFYTNVQAAREHHVVITSFDTVIQGAAACGRP